MPHYKKGSRGPKVKQIQKRLKELGQYNGATDGIYGSRTENAVKAFQRIEGLTVDGIVGPITWKYLFEAEEEEKFSILDQPLAYRTLALTGSFETGLPPPLCFSELSGNFDGQGISFGALQWNVGQGSLQPLLKTMNEQHPEKMRRIFNGGFTKLEGILNSSREEQLEWARSIQDLDSYILDKPWRSYFKRLGQSETFQGLEVKAAGQLYEEAVKLAEKYGLASSRAIALMFDIKVQNGSISDFTEQKIRKEFDELPDTEGETARLCIIANLRSEASKSRWVEDVRIRKLTIATGRGSVHDIHYVLDKEYGIDLNEVLS